MSEIRNIQLSPVDEINGFRVRPGLHLINGATVYDNAVNFTITSINATSCELALFRRTEQEPYAIIPFPDSYRIGSVFSMMVFDLDITEFEYAYRMDGPHDPARGLLFDKTKYLLDPYARAVTGQSVWGQKIDCHNSYHARVVTDSFDWGAARNPEFAFKDLIIYEMHVRGFTQHTSSGVKHRGTFAGIIEKIPYLLELGVNAVELMPIFEFDETGDSRVYEGKNLYNYWGYNTVSFFAPNTSYTSDVEYNREGNELKRLIRTLNENGIEVILDVVFNHTAEGDERGPYISFKGVDNNVYYLLTPDGKYYNFSGCGNAVNCNHPVVQQFILECLRYWTTEYRVDGFRFDLATIMGRNEDGSPMSDPPLLKSMAFDPILSKVKLIAEAWDAGGLYQVGTFPSWSRWAEWNGRYRDDVRRFLKGDAGMANAAINRIIGSPDMYDPIKRGENASVNFMTCHDGFTLHDLYAFNQKHNHCNGWDNTDGDNNGNSWNCGVEGETDDVEVLTLRRRLIKNAMAVLLCSRGAVMFLAGDEFCNTQFGNNNAYCQDNEISWLDWTRLEKNHEMFCFCRDLIAFRKKHAVITQNMTPSTWNLAPISIHNGTAWNANADNETRVIGVLYAGKTANQTQDDMVYLAVNAHWEAHTIELPELPPHLKWQVAFYTALPHETPPSYQENSRLHDRWIALIGRSVLIAEAVAVEGEK